MELKQRPYGKAPDNFWLCASSACLSLTNIFVLMLATIIVVPITDWSGHHGTRDKGQHHWRRWRGRPWFNLQIVAEPSNRGQYYYSRLLRLSTSSAAGAECIDVCLPGIAYLLIFPYAGGTWNS